MRQTPRMNAGLDSIPNSKRSSSRSIHVINYNNPTFNMNIGDSN